MPTRSQAGRRRQPRPTAPKVAGTNLAILPPPDRPSAKKQNSVTRGSRPWKAPHWWPTVAVACILIFFGLIRIRLLHFPLERDEGEYAYAGQLILHAIVPYRFCYSMKLPGTAAAYALIMALFGQTVAGIHLGLLLVNAATTLLLGLLARRLFDRLTGVIAAATFAFLSLEPSVLGFAGHATQFVVLPVIAGILVLLKGIAGQSAKLYFAAGILLGTGLVMKQPGIFFIGFGFFYLICAERARGVRLRQLLPHAGLVTAGAVIPFALTCTIVLASSEFSRFWFWTFSYANRYGTIVTLPQGLQIFEGAISNIVAPAIFLWIIAALGVIAVLWGPKARLQTMFVLGFLIFSFAAVCPGFYFRQHYFVVLLPAIALLSGVAVSRATSMIQHRTQRSFVAILPALVFALAFAASVLHDADFFFASDPVVACHRLYGHNPFPEAPRIADFIRSRSRADDQIAVIGSEPEIYFYSRLRSATGYIYTYPLMEPQPFAASMQQEMESEIEHAMPRFVVFADVPTSWLSGPESNLGILTWAEQFARKHYQLVGLVDLRDQGTEFHWDSDARSYKPRSAARVLVFEKL